ASTFTDAFHFTRRESGRFGRGVPGECVILIWILVIPLLRPGRGKVPRHKRVEQFHAINDRSRERDRELIKQVAVTISPRDSRESLGVPGDGMFTIGTLPDF